MILPLRAAANLFTIPIVAYDQVSTRTGGRTSHATEDDRTIYGVIQPPGHNDALRLPEGFLADGGLLMEVTAGDVSFYDDRSNTPTTENRQTYVRFQGEVWLVKGLEPFDHYNQGIKYYQLTKYVAVN